MNHFIQNEDFAQGFFYLYLLGDDVIKIRWQTTSLKTSIEASSVKKKKKVHSVQPYFVNHLYKNQDTES